MCKGELDSLSQSCDCCQYCCPTHYLKVTALSGVVQFNALIPDHPQLKHPPQAAFFTCIKANCTRKAHGTTCTDCGGQYCLTCCTDEVMNSPKPNTIFGFPVKYDDSLPENVVKFQQPSTGHVSIPVNQLASMGLSAKQAAEAIQKLVQSGKIQPTTTVNAKTGEVVETSFVAVPAKSALVCENCNVAGPTHWHSPNEKDLRNRLCDQCCVALGGPANPCSKWSVSGQIEDHPTCGHNCVVPHSWIDDLSGKTYQCPGPVLDSHGNASPANPNVVIRSVTISEPKERQFALGEDEA